MMFLKAKHKILRRRKYGWLFYYVYFHFEIWLDFLNLHSPSFCYRSPGQQNIMQIRCNSAPKIRFLPLDDKAGSVLFSWIQVVFIKVEK